MRAPLSQTTSESNRRPISYPLNFSTYENTANPLVGHPAPSLLDEFLRDENRDIFQPFPRDPVEVSSYHQHDTGRAKELQGVSSLRNGVKMNL
eukprot:gene9141-9913_t